MPGPSPEFGWVGSRGVWHLGRRSIRRSAGICKDLRVAFIADVRNQINPVNLAASYAGGEPYILSWSGSTPKMSNGGLWGPTCLDMSNGASSANLPNIDLGFALTGGNAVTALVIYREQVCAASEDGLFGLAPAAGDNYLALRAQQASNLISCRIDHVGANIISYTPGATTGGFRMLLVRHDPAGQFELWEDHVIKASQAAVAGLSFASGNAFINRGSNAIAGQSRHALQLVLAWSRALSYGEVFQIFANPYRVFEQPERPRAVSTPYGGRFIKIREGGTGRGTASEALQNLGGVSETTFNAQVAADAAAIALKASLAYVDAADALKADKATGLTATEGVKRAAGVDLSVAAALSMDVAGLTEDTTPDAAADFVPTYDTSAATHKKAKPSNLNILKADKATGLTATEGVKRAAGTDLSAAAALSLDIPGLAAETVPDSVADYVVIYDASGAVHKKVLISNMPAGAPSAHNILSASHGDTPGAAAVVSGDVLYGNNTPKWDRLPKGTDGQILKLASGLPSWAAESAAVQTTKGDLAGYSTVPARIPIGTNGQVLTADSAQTLGLKWAAASGGSGNISSAGAIGSEPGSPASGDLYFGTDAPVIERYTGSIWQRWFKGIPVTDPTTPSWVWRNQGTASVANSNGGVFLSAIKSATNSVKIREIAVPAGAYTITAAFVANIFPLDFAGFGLVLTNGTALHTLQAQHNSTARVLVSKWTNVTTFSADYASTAIDLPKLMSLNAGSLIWLRIVDDATNRKSSISVDGVTWFQLHTVGRTDFLTPTTIGFFVNAGQNTWDVAATLVSWLVT